MMTTKMTRPLFFQSTNFLLRLPQRRLNRLLWILDTLRQLPDVRRPPVMNDSESSLKRRHIHPAVQRVLTQRVFQQPSQGQAQLSNDVHEVLSVPVKRQSSSAWRAEVQEDSISTDLANQEVTGPQAWEVVLVIWTVQCAP